MTRIRLEYVHEYLDRHDKPRRYFRRPGFKRIPLPGAPGSDEFMSAYQLALAGQPPRIEIGAGRTRPGTVNAAIVGYYSSVAFRSLALGTQKLQRSILEQFRAEHGDKRIALLPREFIVRTLGRRSPSVGRNWLKTLRALLQFFIADGFRAYDPTQGVKSPRIKTQTVFTPGPKPRSHNSRNGIRLAQRRVLLSRCCCTLHSGEATWSAWDGGMCATARLLYASKRPGRCSKSRFIPNCVKR